MRRLLPLLLAACTPYVYGTDFHPEPAARLIVWPVAGGHRYALDDGALRLFDRAPDVRVASICLLAPPGAPDDALWELAERHPHASLHLVRPVEGWAGVRTRDQFEVALLRQWRTALSARADAAFDEIEARDARSNPVGRRRIVPLGPGGFAVFGRRDDGGCVAERLDADGVRRAFLVDRPARVEVALTAGTVSRGLALARRLRRMGLPVLLARTTGDPPADIDAAREDQERLFSRRRS